MTQPPTTTPQPHVPALAPRSLPADALRGLAVLGIFVMNITAMALPEMAYVNPTLYGDFSGLNFLAWLLAHLLAELKFITIFSMLFGAGVYWLAESLAQKPGPLSPAKAHYRRMAILFLFGMAHAYLVWYGDILVSYALAGLLIYPMRRLPAWALLLIGIALIACESILYLLLALGIHLLPLDILREIDAAFSPSLQDIQSEIAAYRSGWLTQMTYRVPTAFYFQVPVFLLWTFWRTLGVMAIGVAIAKTGGFHGRWPTWLYLACIASALLIGWPLTIGGVLFNNYHNWSATHLFFWGMQFNYWGSLFVVLAYFAATVLIVRHAPRLLWPLQQTGRMAFTNYLVQSLLGTFIFYGHGLGHFGSVDRFPLLCMALAIGGAQVIFSILWLSKFPQGPAEFAWRRLAYGRARSTPS